MNKAATSSSSYKRAPCIRNISFKQKCEIKSKNRHSAILSFLTNSHIGDTNGEAWLIKGSDELRRNLILFPSNPLNGQRMLKSWTNDYFQHQLSANFMENIGYEKEAGNDLFDKKNSQSNTFALTTSNNTLTFTYLDNNSTNHEKTLKLGLWVSTPSSLHSSVTTQKEVSSSNLVSCCTFFIHLPVKHPKEKLGKQKRCREWPIIPEGNLI